MLGREVDVEESAIGCLGCMLGRIAALPSPAG
jgi:hypothetical protein